MCKYAYVYFFLFYNKQIVKCKVSFITNSCINYNLHISVEVLKSYNLEMPEVVVAIYNDDKLVDTKVIKKTDTEEWTTYKGNVCKVALSHIMSIQLQFVTKDFLHIRTCNQLCGRIFNESTHLLICYFLNVNVIKSQLQKMLFY